MTIKLPFLPHLVSFTQSSNVEIVELDTRIGAIEVQIMAWHKSNPMSQRLASIPGIGTIVATAIAATVAEPGAFRSGREFAAWLGLVPKQRSSGGRTQLFGISKRGDRYCAPC